MVLGIGGLKKLSKLGVLVVYLAICKKVKKSENLEILLIAKSKIEREDLFG
jgi:hypothetical protein